jgi:hypothetical protein
VTPDLLSRAITILGVIAVVLIGGGIYLLAIDKSVDPLWGLAGVVVGGIVGVLVPSGNAPA